MQKLFSQEIRFKPVLSGAEGQDDGSDASTTLSTSFPEWENIKLDNLLLTKIDNRGKTPPLTRSGIPLIEINAIGKKIIDYSKVTKYVDDETYTNWFRNYLKEGDVLFSTVGQTAISSIYEERPLSAIAQNIVGLRFNEQHCSVFMFYLLNEISNNRKFKRIEMGAVQPSIKVSQFIHLKFLFPIVSEQNKIAKFLSILDKKINNTTQLIETGKDFKNSLLQKMFV